MNIAELISSTNSMGGNRTISACFNKEIGTVYTANKEVIFRPCLKEPVVEISMYLDSVTQKDRDLHKVSVALKGMNIENFSTVQAMCQYVKDELGINNILKNKDRFFEIIFVKKMSDYLKKAGKSGKEIEESIQRIRDVYRGQSLEEISMKEQFSSKLNYYSKFQKAIRKKEDYIQEYYSVMDDVSIDKEKWTLEKEQERLNALAQQDLIKEKYARDFINDNPDEYERLLRRHGKKQSSSMVRKTGARDEITKKVLAGDFIPRKEVEDLIPDEFIVDLVLSNPNIISNKIILPRNTVNRMWVAIDNNISLKTECRVRCSCFTSDTRVQLANGMSLTLKDLENMTNFKVLAYNTEIGKYEYARALNCTKRQENARIMKITLADGTSIRVTPSHRFLTSECEWKSAQDLQVGDLLKFNDNYRGYEVHEQKTSSSTFIYLDPTQPGDYEFGELRFTHKPFYVGITTGAYVKIENERCLEYLNRLADTNEQPLMFKQYYHVDEHVALQLKEKLVNRIGTVERGSVLVNNPVQVNNNYINKEDKCIEIIYIEELEEREDVYCLTVEGLGNFAIQTNNGNIIVENCADYLYTYAWYNNQNKANIGGKPLEYYNSSIIVENPVRNPRKRPGLCKHLVIFLSILMRDGLLNEPNTTWSNDLDKFIINNPGVVKTNATDIRKKILDLDEQIKKYNAQLVQQRDDVKQFNKQIIQERERLTNIVPNIEDETIKIPRKDKQRREVYINSKKLNISLPKGILKVENLDKRIGRHKKNK